MTIVVDDTMVHTEYNETHESPTVQNVITTDWDYLIVLDACRYDIFEAIYDEYLDGYLEKRQSPGSATPEWAAKTFTDQHDITYLSANPFINSSDIPLSEATWGASCEYDWTATNHITEVVDLWRDAWDADLGTVVPESVTDHARDRSRTTNGQMIIHYLQPHAPFLRRGKGRKVTRIRDGFTNGPERTRTNSIVQWLGAIGDELRARIEPLLGHSQRAMQLGMLVELTPASLLTLGRNGIATSLRQYHEENLRLALESVTELVTMLDGRVIVTSDHGEAFGEHGIWEHQVETHIPPLVEVPWLVVE